MNQTASDGNHRIQPVHPSCATARFGSECCSKETCLMAAQGWELVGHGNSGAIHSHHGTGGSILVGDGFWDECARRHYTIICISLTCRYIFHHISVLVCILGCVRDHVQSPYLLNTYLPSVDSAFDASIPSLTMVMVYGDHAAAPKSSAAGGRGHPGGDRQFFHSCDEWKRHKETSPASTRE